MMRIASLLVVSVGAAACGSVVNSADARPGGGTDAPASADAPATADASPDASPDAPAGTLSFVKTSAWNCAFSIDCEDVYDFDLAASASVNVTVSGVDGASAPRLGLFNGNTTTTTNLWNNATTAVCGTQNKDLSAGPVTIAPGHYRLTVGRDWGQSGGAAGNYTVTFRASTPFSTPSQTADDAGSTQPHC